MKVSAINTASAAAAICGVVLVMFAAIGPDGGDDAPAPRGSTPGAEPARGDVLLQSQSKLKRASSLDEGSLHGEPSDDHDAVKEAWPAVPAGAVFLPEAAYEKKQPRAQLRSQGGLLDDMGSAPTSAFSLIDTHVVALGVASGAARSQTASQTLESGLLPFGKVSWLKYQPPKWPIIIGQTVVVLLVAWVYSSYYRHHAAEAGSQAVVASLPKEEDLDNGFHFGLFDCENCCARDQRICLCGWCCPGIRWADTISQDKNHLKISFWTLLLINLVCCVFNTATLGATGVIFLIPAIYYRQQLRKLFGLKFGTFDTCCCDLLVWCFCSPCAAIQEAREVEYLPIKNPTD